MNHLEKLMDYVKKEHKTINKWAIRELDDNIKNLNNTNIISSKEELQILIFAHEDLKEIIRNYKDEYKVWMKIHIYVNYIQTILGDYGL